MLEKLHKITNGSSNRFTTSRGLWQNNLFLYIVHHNCLFFIFFLLNKHSDTNTAVSHWSSEKCLPAVVVNQHQSHSMMTLIIPNWILSWIILETHLHTRKTFTAIFRLNSWSKKCEKGATLYKNKHCGDICDHEYFVVVVVVVWFDTDHFVAGLKHKHFSF